jgi:hypothetical protein
MDRFIKKTREISNSNLTKLGRTVAIIGPSGVGKTHAVHEALQGDYVEITAEILKSKQGTIDFLEKLASSPLPVVLDEYETVCDLIGIREIKGPPSRGQFFIISQIEVKFDFEIYEHEFVPLSFEKIRDLFPGAPEELIRASNGNIRTIIQELEFKSDKRDKFMSIEEFILDLISTRSTKSPFKMMSQGLTEPGNTMSIIHENLIDCNLSLESYIQITESLSLADTYETRVYSGLHDDHAYFCFHGVSLPACIINHGFNSEKIRAGSLWTKYQNECMRKRRIVSALYRRKDLGLCYEGLLLLKRYALLGIFEVLKEYGLEPFDVDTINHLTNIKLKPKAVSALKKFLTPP